MRGAWIEILTSVIGWVGTVSHPVRGAWIEMVTCTKALFCCASHPVRGAWIEIMTDGFDRLIDAVAPREGCVD